MLSVRTVYVLSSLQLMRTQRLADQIRNVRPGQTQGELFPTQA